MESELKDTPVSSIEEVSHQRPCSCSDVCINYLQIPGRLCIG
jgi:hypothetical protein